MALSAAKPLSQFVGGSARLGHATSIPSPGDGTSPTGAEGGHASPRCARSTSSRAKSGPVLCYMGPYRTQGTAGPVGGGPRGRQGRSTDPNRLQDDQGGIGIGGSLCEYMAHDCLKTGLTALPEPQNGPSEPTPGLDNEHLHRAQWSAAFKLINSSVHHSNLATGATHSNQGGQR